jgi:glycopeptide antibiotics resistance protein
MNNYTHNYIEVYKDKKSGGFRLFQYRLQSIKINVVIKLVILIINLSISLPNQTKNNQYHCYSLNVSYTPYNRNINIISKASVIKAKIQQFRLMVQFIFFLDP